MALGKLSRFERLFSPTIIERGINYKNSGAVRQLIGQKLASDAITVNKRQQWSAIVYGSQRYPVQVTLTQMPDGDMTIDSLSCQCPYGDAYDDYCKHLVAVLLRIREQLKSGEAILEENAIIEDAIVNTNPVIDSEALLQSLDKPALQEFIQQCLLHHPHLLDELVIWASRYKEKAPEEDNSALRDPKVLQSMHRQVDAILDIDNRYYDDYDDYYASESDFRDESVKFEQIFDQFDNQLQYQVACVLYWLGRLIDVNEEYPERDISEGFYVGFAKFGQLVFGIAENEQAQDYHPSWSGALILYQTNLHKELLTEVRQQVDDWQMDNIYETDSSYQPERVGFDLLIAKQDWYAALALLNGHIEVEKLSRYGDYQLESLVTLKIALLNHLQNSDLVANQLIANGQISEVLSEFAYLPKIRGLLIDKALSLGEVNLAVRLISQGIDIAKEEGHTGTVIKWQKQLVNVILQAGDLPVQTDMTEIIRQNCKSLAFDGLRKIDEYYYKKWRDSYPPDEWQTVISAQQDSLRRLIQRHNPQPTHSFQVGGFELFLLAQTYSLEADTKALIELLKSYPHASLLKDYQDQIIAADAAWLIDFYKQQWTQRIEQVNGRKEYKELAGDIQRMLAALPAATTMWKPLVKEWQRRFSEYPRKPALLDELSKIHWPKV